MSSIELGASYIRQCRTLGFSDAEIIQAMQSRGWQTMDVNAALMQASAAQTKPKGNRWLWIILVTLVIAVLTVTGIIAWLVTSGQLNG